MAQQAGEQNIGCWAFCLVYLTAVRRVLAQRGQSLTMVCFTSRVRLGERFSNLFMFMGFLALSLTFIFLLLVPA